MNKQIMTEVKAATAAPLESEHLFQRDGLTWLGYLLVSSYCFLTAGLGPLMPFLRSELGLSYTVAAYHFSAFAVGVLLAGLSGDRWMRALGLRKAVWWAAAGIVAGALVMITGHHPAVTISGALILGAFGSMQSQSVTTVMCRRFREQRAIAISEINIAASIAASAAPASVALSAVSGLGWRAVFLLYIVVLVFLWLLFRKTGFVGDGDGKTESARGSLPAAYWAYWGVVLLSVAGEWSINFWSAEFLRSAGGLSKADAAASVSAFLCAMLVGRLAGARLSRQWPVTRMLPFAAVLAVFGFLPFWLAPSAVGHVAGLFLTGLGVANVYPFALAAAIGTAPEHVARASARMSAACGIAVIVAPLLLGCLADRAGVPAAFGIVFVAFTLSAGMVFVANRLATERGPETSIAEVISAVGLGE